MAYKYTNKGGQEYFLHGKEVKLRSKIMQRIYYFAREVRSDSLDEIPEGFMVVENRKTGLPVLKRK